MATCQLTAHLKGVSDGVPLQAGALDVPFNITVTGDNHVQIITVATSTTVDIFNDDTDLADFDVLWIQADFDVMVELTVDKDADVGTEVIALRVPGSGTANELGRPIVLPSNIAKANYTINFAAGTDDVIDRVRVRNESSTQAARVFIAAFT